MTHLRLIRRLEGKAIAPLSTPVPRARATHRRGALAVEMVLGLMILAVAVLLVAELSGRIVQRSRSDRFIADLREISEVFRSHLNSGGKLGSDALPRELEEALQATNWTKGSPFGGVYEWRPAVSVIAVTAFAPQRPLTLTRAELQAIDAQIDDGDLSRGRLQRGFNGWPVFRIE